MTIFQIQKRLSLAENIEKNRRETLDLKREIFENSHISQKTFDLNRSINYIC